MREKGCVMSGAAARTGGLRKYNIRKEKILGSYSYGRKTKQIYIKVESK